MSIAISRLLEGGDMNCKLMMMAVTFLWLGAGCWAQEDLEPDEVNKDEQQPLVMLTGKDMERSEKSEIVQRVKATLTEIGAVKITEGVRKEGKVLVPWRWVVLNDNEWSRASLIYGTSSPLAFGNLNQRVTYVRGYKAAQMSSAELQLVLAHELGHLVCWCEDEDTATREGKRILASNTDTKRSDLLRAKRNRQ